VTDEALAVMLGLKTLGTARFWKVKARMMLEQEQQQAAVTHRNGHQRGEAVNLDEYTTL
jgi:hypothetical protein